MDATKEAMIKAEDDGRTTYCARCGDQLYVIGYVCANDVYPWYSGKFCHGCCPHGTTMVPVKIEQRRET